MKNIPRHYGSTLNQNYISATTIRDISVLRNDLLSALTSAGLVQVGQRATVPELNVHAGEPALLKALLLAALYPHVAHIALPRHAVKFSRIASGTVAREPGAHEWRAKDMRGARVWVHPASTLFAETRWRSGIVVSFERVETAHNNNNKNKVYLRDVTEVRSFSLNYEYKVPSVEIGKPINITN
jgi:ATP-dependent RNA helicase DHX57